MVEEKKSGKKEVESGGVIRRIVLENFMSHPRTVIEPAAGLTVLVGPNNCGKSAVAVALETLASNAAGDFMVRHGAPICRVIVETDDGHTIEWKRKGATVSYRIDGRDIHRLNRSIPDGLHDLLRLPDVEVEGVEPFRIHFAEQKSPIFLLDRPGRPAAAFFASSSDAGLLLEMQRRHRARVQGWNHESDAHARSIERLRTSLGALEPLEEIEGRLEGCEALHRELREETAALARLEEAARELGAAEVQTARAADRIAALGPLAAPPDLAPTAALEDLLAGLESGSREVAKLVDRSGALGSLAGPPGLADAEGLALTMASLEAAATARRAAGDGVGILEGLEAPPALSDSKDLEDRLAGLALALEAVAVEASTVAAISSERDGAAAAIERWLEENPVCPLCGSSVDPEQFLRGRPHQHV